MTRTCIDPTPDVNCRYGAPMGRQSSKGYTVTADALPLRLVRVPIDSGGYDRGGAYWGLGEPMYYYEAPPTGLVFGYVRGKTRELAKAQVLKIHPDARFYK